MILQLYVEKVSSSIRTKLTHHYPLSLTAWYIYEYILMLHVEVDVIWKSKFSLTTILFLVNRYAFFLELILVLVGDVVLAKDIQVSHPMSIM